MRRLLASVATLSLLAGLGQVSTSARADEAATRTLMATTKMGVEHPVEVPADLVRCADPQYTGSNVTVQVLPQAGPWTHPEDLAARGVGAGHEPVLLVHGTFTNGNENYRWAQAEHLADLGYAACWMTYPNRGFDDQQASGEYVAGAIVELSEAFGGADIDVLGHSQGATLPRWAIGWFPEARGVVDDLVQFAGPNYGTGLTNLYGKAAPLQAMGGESYAGGCSEYACTGSSWQFSPDSMFTEALNRGDDLRDDVDYTSIYSVFDELVRSNMGTAEPRGEVETPAALRRVASHVTNVYVQDVCPGRPVDHVSFFVDRMTSDVARMAFDNPGPAGPALADVMADQTSLLELCAGGMIDSDYAMAAVLWQESMYQPTWQPVPAEPAQRAYAAPEPQPEA